MPGWGEISLGTVMVVHGAGMVWGGAKLVVVSVCVSHRLHVCCCCVLLLLYYYRMH